MTDASPDLSNLPRFLEHLAERDADAADFARRLLDAGAAVRVFWGPEQMGVWELVLQRDQVLVRFGAERGYSDAVLIAPADEPLDSKTLRHIRLAVVAWAGANGIPLSIDDPDGFDMDLKANGIAVVDWVGNGHHADVERVYCAQA